MLLIHILIRTVPSWGHLLPFGGYVAYSLRGWASYILLNMVPGCSWSLGLILDKITAQSLRGSRYSCHAGDSGIVLHDNNGLLVVSQHWYSPAGTEEEFDAISRHTVSRGFWSTFPLNPSGP